MKTKVMLVAVTFLFAVSLVSSVRVTPEATAEQVERVAAFYQVNTGDVIGLYCKGEESDEGHSVFLHAVQPDGRLHLPFGTVDASDRTMAEIRDAIDQHKDEAAKKGMHDLAVTIVDLRNSTNDEALQNLGSPWLKVGR